MPPLTGEAVIACAKPGDVIRAPVIVTYVSPIRYPMRGLVPKGMEAMSVGRGWGVELGEGWPVGSGDDPGEPPSQIALGTTTAATAAAVSNVVRRRRARSAPARAATVASEVEG